MRAAGNESAVIPLSWTRITAAQRRSASANTWSRWANHEITLQLRARSSPLDGRSATSAAGPGFAASPILRALRPQDRQSLVAPTAASREGRGRAAGRLPAPCGCRQSFHKARRAAAAGGMRSVPSRSALQTNAGTVPRRKEVPHRRHTCQHQGLPLPSRRTSLSKAMSWAPGHRAA